MLQNARNAAGYTALHSAAFAGSDAVCKELLLKTEEGVSAAVNAEEPLYKQTALHIAAHKGHLRIVKLLLRAGADGLLRDRDGEACRGY